MQNQEPLTTDIEELTGRTDRTERTILLCLLQIILMIFVGVASPTHFLDDWR